MQRAWWALAMAGVMTGPSGPALGAAAAFTSRHDQRHGVPCPVEEAARCVLHTVWIRNDADQPLACTGSIVLMGPAGQLAEERASDRRVPPGEERAIIRRVANPDWVPKPAVTDCKPVTPPEPPAPQAAVEDPCRGEWRVSRNPGQAVMARNGRDITALVAVTVERDRGYATNVRLIRGTGLPDLDTLALQAAWQVPISTACTRLERPLLVIIR